MSASQPVVGTIAYSTTQGIAHLAWDFQRHGLIQRVLIAPHPHYKGDPARYPPSVGFHPGEYHKFLDGLDLLLLFETYLVPQVLREAQRRGIPVAVCVNFEYTPWPFPGPVKMFLCPSEMDAKVYSSLPYLYLPIPVDTNFETGFPWIERKQALSFIHNMGHAQWQYGKGTPELVEAMSDLHRRGSKIRLRLRGQPEDGKVAELYRKHKSHPLIDWEMGTVSRRDLYAGDCFVYCQRYNGLSLPLQEAFASGMLVITTDMFPQNLWLPREPLVPVDKYEDVSIAVKFKRAVLDPKRIADTLERWYRQDISALSCRGRDWAREMSWESIGPKWRKVLEGML
jgi:glycosyltransferase involved in cell wall biosynthesis